MHTASLCYGPPCDPGSGHDHDAHDQGDSRRNITNGRCNSSVTMIASALRRCIGPPATSSADGPHPVPVPLVFAACSMTARSSVSLETISPMASAIGPERTPRNDRERGSAFSSCLGNPSLRSASANTSLACRATTEASSGPLEKLGAQPAVVTSKARLLPSIGPDDRPKQASL
jgi:hypothetical protein